MKAGSSDVFRFCILSALLVLNGCATEPVEQPAAAPSASPPPSAPVAVVTPPKPKPLIVPTHQVPNKQTNPLLDPTSPLAKRSVYYELDQATIRSEFRPMIEAHASYLRKHPGTAIRIEGNCDEQGSREYNLALGQRRAESVLKALVISGAPVAQIETVSWGEEKPKAPGHDEPSWSQNRRSDIVYK